MHDVDAFEAQVSAYPAVTVIGNREQGAPYGDLTNGHVARAWGTAERLSG